MTPSFRSTALAAMLAALSIGASAGPVVLNFEVLGQQALGDPTATPKVDPAPVQVNTVGGFSFGGSAWAYHFGMIDEDVDNGPGDATNQGGFIINRSRDVTTAGTIVLSIDNSGLYKGRYFNALQFDVFTSAGAATVSAFNAKNEKRLVADLTATDGNKFWTTTDDNPIDEGFQATRIEFFTASAVIGLDNISITLSDATTAKVPEPASYALVGLALLGVGLARRRTA